MGLHTAQGGATAFAGPITITRNGPRSSGVPGVRMKWQRGVWYWMAEWYPEPNAPRRKLFSIPYYGDQSAMEYAIAHRNQQLAALRKS